MCGIVGLVKKQGMIDSQEFNQHINTIGHRGPDASNSYIHQNIALGHARLKIIDLSDESNQPMVSDCGNFILIYNGEIYNYIELRDELIALGHHFTTTGDTEVLLKSYLAWDQEAVHRFNGMWSFVIFDKKNNTLFGSRDRFGIKPFYYAFDSQGFYFASEIRALLNMGVSRKANLAEVQSFLLTQLHDHGDETFYEKINCLQPGCNLEFDISKHELKTYPYYHLAHQINTSESESLIEQFSDLLNDSVNLRMRADLEVGSCLSGGLDSSSVAALASLWGNHNNTGKPLTAFTAVSTDPKNDESAYAKAVSDAHGMHSIHLTPTYEQFMEHLPDIVKTQEEPFGGPSIVMQYLLMQKIKASGIRVLLDGQGGDELLLGYPKYSAAFLMETLRKSGPRAAHALAKQYMRNNAGQSYKSLAQYFVATYSSRARFQVYKHKMPFLNASKMPDILKIYGQSAKNMGSLQALECMSTNLPALLRYEDKNSMAFGIEARLPFLDHRLVEFSLSLPSDYKIRQGWTKWILREAMKDKLPAHIVWRKNKMGFEAPENSWLNSHADEMLHQVQSSSLLKNLVQMDKLTKHFPKLGLRNQWRLYSVALWEKAFNIV